MAGYVGSDKATLVHGDYHPAELYKGDAKRAGWKPHTESNVTSATIEDTYNDTADVVVKGNTVQASDWYAKDGVSSQAGTPTPDAPIPITSNLPAGTYKYTSNDGIYEFTLTEELRGIGTNVDKIVFDRVSHMGYLERRVGKNVFDGTEAEIGTAYNSSTSADGILRFAFPIATMNQLSDSLCSNFALITNNEMNAVPNTKIGYSTKLYKNYMYIAIEKTRIDYSETDTVFQAIVKFKDWLSLNNVTVEYQLATPTRTPLTFTKVTSSTATEVPMTFLTNTPSLDYPAQVWDASGNMIVNGEVIATIPPLRKAGDVPDEYHLKTGNLTRRIGRIESYNGEDVGDNWVSSTGGLDIGATVCYQLAEPVITQLETVTIPTYYPTTVFETDCKNAIPTMDINCKIIDTEV